MNDLVRRLAEGSHPVTAGGPKPSARQLKEAIDRQYVHIKFTDTKGATDLGVKLDKDALSLAGADFEKPSGTVHLEGTLTLDYVSVRCVADLDLATLNGTGHLLIVESEKPETTASAD